VDYKWPETNSDQEKINASPIVVVAKVVSDQKVGSLVPSYWRPDIKYNLSRLTLQVENVLRGDLKPGLHDVFYFKLYSSVGPRLLGVWQPTSRFLFFMTRDQGVIRLASDGYGYCERRIYSGAHPSYHPEPGKSIDCIFADLALTEGEDCLDTQFVRGFPWVMDVPKCSVVPKLEVLAKSKNALIAKAACNTLEENLRVKCPS
jgi:hypothetical protein